MNLSFSLTNSQLLVKLVIALIISLTGEANLAKAQSLPQKVPQRVINGLFSPTESERFFQEGILKFESEAKILINLGSYPNNGDILQISPLLLKPQKYPSYFDQRSDFSGEVYLLSPDLLLENHECDRP